MRCPSLPYLKCSKSLTVVMNTSEKSHIKKPAKIFGFLIYQLLYLYYSITISPHYNIFVAQSYKTRILAKIPIIPISMIAKNIATNATVTITVIVYLMSSGPFGHVTFLISRDTSFKNLNIVTVDSFK